MENDIQYPNGQPRTPAGRRGRRPLRMFFDKQLKGRGGAASSWRGDASIAPYIPFTDGTVGRGLDPSYAVCNDGNIYHLLHNKKSYVGGGVPDAPDGAYVIACGGARPLPTNRWKMTSNIQTVNRAHLRGVEDAAPYGCFLTSN